MLSSRMLISRLLQNIRSLQWRLMFIFVLITVALMMFSSISLIYSVQASFYDSFKSRLVKGFENLSMKDEPEKIEIMNHLQDGGKELLYIFGITEFKSLTIINKNTNEVLFSSDKLYEENKNKFIEDLFKAENFISALANKTGENGKLINNGNNFYFDFAKMKGDFIFYFKYDREEWQGTIDKFNDIIKISFLIAVLLSLIIGFFLAKTITIPVVSLMHSARRIAAGKFEAQLEVKSNDEIGKLTNTFNFMARELKTTINMRKEFVANVSHELRTPLTSIKSYTETLLDGALENKDTLVKFLTTIDTEADRMARLVKDLLQLSKFDNNQLSFDYAKNSLVEIITTVIEKLKIEAENKDIEIIFEKTKNNFYCKVDSDRIQQVFINIITNAIKYTENNGKIEVKILEEGNDIKISISDTGMGIPEEDLPRIFERFYRVDKARSRDLGGSGLGLSIAKEIIEAHKGKIFANSTVGQGTEVVLFLPQNV